jgi:subtilisin family serine protease
MVASVIESETLRTSLVRVVTALEEMLAVFQRPEHAGKPIILNLSLGFLPDALSPDDLQAVVKGIERILGTLRTTFQVLPIVAVGNDGNGIVRAPATFADTLSVGAVGDDLTAASFSGGGISTLSGEWEPNFVGYGVDILSSYQRTQEGISEYLRMSGTSMAAPYVAGIAALYAGQDPSLQGAKLWAKLQETALPLAGDPDRVGGGLVRFVQEG